MAETLLLIWLIGSVAPLLVGRFDLAVFVFGLPLLAGFAAGALFVAAVLIGIPIFIVYIFLAAIFG